jgi:hypothetical protein
MTQTEALRLALEALENIDRWLPTIGQKGLRDYEADAITAIKAALEAKDEPVAIVAEIYMSRYTIEWINGDLPEGTNLYTTPPQRTWVGLTDKEIEAIWEVAMFAKYGVGAELSNQPFVHYARGIEAKLKEKNT